MSRFRSCPVAACPNARRSDQLVCAAHWRMLPRELQREIYVEYKAWRGFDQTPNYFWARERALALCEGREPDIDYVTRLLEATSD